MAKRRFALINSAPTVDLTGYLTAANINADSYTPVGTWDFSGATVTGLTISAISDFTDNSTNWNTAYGWGDHAGLYPLLGTTTQDDNYLYLNRTIAGTGVALYVVQASTGAAARIGTGTIGSTTFSDYVDIGRAGNHIEMFGTAPKFKWNETDAGTDEKIWDIVPVSGEMRFRLLNDSDASSTNWMTVDRTGYASAYVNMPATTQVDFYGPVGARNGTNGDYASTGAAATWGATIWGMDTAFDGGTAGANSSSTSCYGLRWLRGSHTESTKGEGLHVKVNGTSYYELGTSGMLVNQSGGIYLVDTNTRIHEGSSNSVQITTNSGYLQLGPQNTTWCHLVTDRANFYFNKGAAFATQPKFYNLGAIYYNGGSGYASGKVTYSTSAATGGSSGDMWFQYT